MGRVLSGLQIYNNIIVNNKVGILMGDEAVERSNLQQYHKQVTNMALILVRQARTTRFGVVNLMMKNNIISNCSQWGMRVGSFRCEKRCWRL